MERLKKVQKEGEKGSGIRGESGVERREKEGDNRREKSRIKMERET